MGRPEQPPFLKVGDRFTRLVVVEDLGLRRHGARGTRRVWLCRCDCGKTVRVPKHQLMSGMTNSCGCYQRDRASEAGEANAVHGHARGSQRTPEYRAWRSMISRCTNSKLKAYRDYGGRGIRVCRAWRVSFETFLKDVGYKPSPELELGRIDNEGDYRPGNVRWETVSQNARNRRSSALITANGKTQTLAAWAKQTGLGRTTIGRRLAIGWTEEEAVNLPLMKRVY